MVPPSIQLSPCTASCDTLAAFVLCTETKRMGTLSSIYPPRCAYGLLRAVFVAMLGSMCGMRAQTVRSASTSSALAFPADVAFDTQGNLYFSDTNHQRVQRLDTAGIVSTVAGSGVQGFAGDGGLATAAELDSPSGLVVDTAGDLYIADTHNHRVRRVDGGTGQIATVAGTGLPGYAGDGGAGTAARLNLPMALTLDAGGNLYIADTNNHRVRELTAGGLIHTVAGDGLQGFSGDGGSATAAAIDSPGGLAMDAAGALYIADTHNQRLRVVRAGTITTVAGTGAPGFGGDGAPAATARLALPHGVSVDGAGNVYVADTNNHRVRRIAPDGSMETIAGNGVEAFRGDGGLAVAASLSAPRGVAVSPGGLPTIADTANQRVRQVEDDGTIVTLAGAGAATPVGASTLTLRAPGPIVYGSGTVTATLSGGGQPTGMVTFLEGGTALGSVALSGAQAAFATDAFDAGTHAVYASYSGDGSHAAATSPALLLPVLPAPLAATTASLNVIYGQSVPPLTGLLTGVLPRDAAAVSLQLVSAARGLSPVGTYPVSASIRGAAAGNYVLRPVVAAVTIAKAGSVASLVESATTVTATAPVTFTVHLASTTSGLPTGSVTLMDGAVALAAVPLSSTGDATYTSMRLAAGTHSFVGIYAGDGNFTGSTTAVQTVAVIAPPAPDFTLAATGQLKQTVPAGSAANYSFAVQTEGGTLAGPITLATSGLPAGTTASFYPGSVVDAGTGAFQLTLQTVKPLQAASLVWLGGCLLLPLCSRALRRKIAGVAFLVGLMGLGGCGATVIAVAPAAKSYVITVSGTATGTSGTLLQHTATVTLSIQ